MLNLFSNKYKINIVKQMLEQNGGRFFSVTFIKKNGDERKMVCRTGVHQYLIHPERESQKKDTATQTVFDVQQMEYRSFNIERVKSIRLRHMEFNLE